MSNYTKKTVELIAEINDICKKNDIKYIVGGNVARAAYSSKMFVAPKVELYVGDRFSSLIRAIKKNLKRERRLERYSLMADRNSTETRIALPETHWRYVDMTSVYYDFRDLNHYQYNGQYLELIPIQRMETPYLKSKNDKEKRDIKAMLFEDTKAVEIYGTSIVVPRNQKLYMDVLFGKPEKGKTKLVYPTFPRETTVSAANVPFNVLCDKIEDLDGVCNYIRESIVRMNELETLNSPRVKQMKDAMAKIKKAYR